MRAQTAEKPKERHGNEELVLLIEDDADVRSMTATMLEYLGYQVVDVPDAAAAQTALSRDPEFKMVVSDVILPGGTSGPEFIEQALKNYPALKVLFISGYPFQKTQRHSKLGPSAAMRSKPFKLEQFSSASREVLD